MSNSIIRNKWTEEQLSYLKTAYLQGTPLKRIATKLNRTVSAINKTLARHHLRTDSKMERRSCLSQPTRLPLKQKRALGAFIRKQSISKSKLSVIDHRQETSIETVIYWLINQNISVTRSKNDVYYEVNGCPMNEQQILYKANVLREQFQLPIFWVKGVTHS